MASDNSRLASEYQSYRRNSAQNALQKAANNAAGAKERDMAMHNAMSRQHTQLEDKAKNNAQQVAEQNASFVRHIQRKTGNGLKVDGIAGPKTHAALGLRFNGQVNMTSNSRAGQTYQTIPTKGGVIHQYRSGERVFVRKPSNTDRHYF